MRDTGALDHRDGPLELHRRDGELSEQRRPPAQDDRHELDADLVKQTGLQALSGHLPAVNDDVLCFLLVRRCSRRCGLASARGRF